MHHGRYDGIIRWRGLVFSKMELSVPNNSLSSGVFRDTALHPILAKKEGDAW